MQHQTQQKVEIATIRIGANPRQDFGDLTELKNSIQEHGIMQPLIVKRRDHTGFELIAGERRLRAAKELGFKEVPVAIIEAEAEEVAELKLVENLQRKDLSILEESDAINEYMQKTKHDEEWTAKKLGMSKGWVHRRVLLKNLGPEARKALDTGKIGLGHANLIGQLRPEEQKETLKLVAQRAMDVEALAEFLRWKDLDMTEQGIKLRSNGQKLLPELPENGGWMIAQTKAMKADFANYLVDKRKELKAKKIQVFGTEAELRKKYPKAARVGSWEAGYDKIVAKLPESKDYGVLVDFRNGNIIKEVYRLTEPPKDKKEAKERDVQNTAKTLGQDAKDVLERKVREYKRSVLINGCEAKLEPGTKAALLLNLWAVSNTHYAGDLEDFETISKLTAAKLDKMVFEHAKELVSELDDEELPVLASMVKFSLEKDWQIDKDFLDLHTIPQLQALGKELKLELAGSKKGEIIEEILKGTKKGMVPKIMVKA